MPKEEVRITKNWNSLIRAFDDVLKGKNQGKIRERKKTRKKKKKKKPI